jgi:hypothetical protein
MIINTRRLEGARAVRGENRELVERLKRHLADSTLIVRHNAPATYRLATRVSRWFTILKCCFLSVLVVISAARLISCIPTDLRAEETYLSYFDQQRLSECERDYRDSNCGDGADDPICAELRECLSDRQAATKRATVGRLLWGTVNSFFLALTPKAAWVLGIASGIFLFVCLFM